jgi:hypothetical protein
MAFYIIGWFVMHPVFRAVLLRLDSWVFGVHARVPLPSPLSPSHHLDLNGNSASGLYGRL